MISKFHSCTTTFFVNTPGSLVCTVMALMIGSYVSYRKWREHGVRKSKRPHWEVLACSIAEWHALHSSGLLDHLPDWTLEFLFMLGSMVYDMTGNNFVFVF